MSAVPSPSVPSPRSPARARLAAACALLAALAMPARAGEALRIAASRAPVSLPLYVALQQGFFEQEGLDVTIKDCIGGTRCLQAMLDGQADVATTSEMPVVLHAFERADVVVIATIVNASDNLKLIARKASGIVRSEQLDGRKVGVVAGTAAQYLVETHLLTVGVDPRRVTMVPIQAEETVAALRSGRVDAVAMWEPYGYAALRGDGAASVGVRLPLTGGYIESYNLVASRRILGLRDAALVKMLRAVERAERFIELRPQDARTVLRDRLALDPQVVDWVWNGLGFRLSLDQSLLSTMETETRWAQREGHVPAGARPNVLTLIDPGPLKAVQPAAVGTGN